MKELATFAAFFALGYLVVEKLAPTIQAKIEAMDLDNAWDVFDEESETW